MAHSLKQRLLRDIAELQSKPYPNVVLHVQDDDLTQACLILTVKGYGPMHLTIHFPADFPVSPPKIRMDSNVDHPNVFNDYICASILNTTEGYTSAYALKGIAIQLLSFFGSDKIEQVGGYGFISLNSYRTQHTLYKHKAHTCVKCSFGRESTAGSECTSMAGIVSSTTPPHSASSRDMFSVSRSKFVEDTVTEPATHPQGAQSIGRNAKRRRAKENALARAEAAKTLPFTPAVTDYPSRHPQGIQDMVIPNEILLLICENLETEDMMAFAEAWVRVGCVVTKYDIIRTRELQCFLFKKDYTTIKLGVGVAVTREGRIGSLESEFDLLSIEAYQTHNIRRSTLGVPFEHWLPLPISRGHWNKVRDDACVSLSTLATAASLEVVPPVQVIYRFMNDIVVKLNAATSRATTQSPYYPWEEITKSSLTHASEKAIESYFHLFHLLLCMATSNPAIIISANDTLQAFAQGRNSKTDVPNLGLLLVQALISDVEMSDGMIKSIIKETITRNVVWMLDAKGAGMAELAYLEPSAVSEYRLQKTFDAGMTSYRLLMFLNLFRKTAVGNPPKPLTTLRDEAFERHGAPPRGSAKGLAQSIKRIHQVSNFPEFLVSMGIGKPSAAWFCNFLKECMTASVTKGYSKMPISQDHALFLRKRKEPGVEVVEGSWGLDIDMSRISFFPGKSNYSGNRGNRRR